MAKFKICLTDLKHLIEIDTKTNINKKFNQVDYNKETLHKILDLEYSTLNKELNKHKEELEILTW